MRVLCAFYAHTLVLLGAADAGACCGGGVASIVDDGWRTVGVRMT